MINNNFDLFGFPKIENKRKIKHSTNYNKYYFIDYDKKRFKNNFLHINSSRKLRKYKKSLKYKPTYTTKINYKSLKRNVNYIKCDGSIFKNNNLLYSYIKRCMRFYIFY